MMAQGDGMSAVQRRYADAIRLGRMLALEAAIMVCEECIKTGDSVETCVKMLRDLKTMLEPKMDS